MMRRYRTLLLCALSSAVTSIPVATVNGPAGGYFGVGTKGLQVIAAVLVPPLVDKIKHLKVNDIKTHKSGFDIKLYDMRVSEFHCDDSCIVPAFGDNGKVDINVPKIHIKFHLRAEAKKSIFKTSIKCDANIGTGHISASGDLSTSGGKLTLGGVKADADVGHFDPNCPGSVSGDLVDVISSLFKDHIKSKINDLVKQNLQEVVQTEAAALLSGIHWTFDLEKGIAAADFTPSTVSSSSAHLSLGVRAEIINPSSPEDPPAPKPSVPAWSTASPDAYLQAVLSAWSLDSVAYTYWKLGRLQRTITTEDVSQLTTGFVGLFAPGLLFKYPRHNMSIFSRFTEGPKAVVQPSGVVASAPATFEFNVVNETGDVIEQAFLVGTNVSLGLNFGVVTNSTGLFLTAFVTKATFPLSVLHSNVGGVHIGGLGNLTNRLVDDVLVPLLNKKLEAGLPLPSTPKIKLKNAKLAPLDGYLLVGTQFDVAPLAALEA